MRSCTWFRRATWFAYQDFPGLFAVLPPEAQPLRGVFQEGMTQASLAMGYLQEVEQDLATRAMGFDFGGAVQQSKSFQDIQDLGG